MTKTIHFLTTLVIAAVLIGSISVGPVAFADDDDDDDDDDDKPKKEKTLEQACAKKKPTSLDGLLCAAIFSLQLAIADLQNQIDAIPASTVDWLDITNRPAGLDDGDDNTIYTDADAVAAMGAKSHSNSLNHDRYTDAEAVSAVIAAIGPHTVDTNADTICSTGELLDGDGNCIPIPTSGGGTVTEVNTGLGLIGGPITTTGTISVENRGILTQHIADDAVRSHHIQTGQVGEDELRSIPLRFADSSQPVGPDGQPINCPTNYVVTGIRIVETAEEIVQIQLTCRLLLLP